ncbi:MAG: zinc ribbon domain-containing protein [Gammaproteobacteria bacterium]|nr:zinc ribbon domain-containing protein [Gammaproteobacteria bacterium]
MASPKEYWQRIEELGLDHMEIEVSSIAEAKTALRRVRGLQKELRQIKKNINLDMKSIRAMYRQKMATAASTTSSIVSLFGKRKLAGQLRADEKRRLRMERDSILEPYESLKFTIDNLLLQLDAAKEQIQQFIEDTKHQSGENKQSLSSTKELDTETIFCPQCGVVVEKTDKFCRNCGYKL